MNNFNDILARLENGETAESIAEEMTAALNNAQEAFAKAQAAKRQEEEEQKAKAVQEAAVRIATEHLASALLDWAYVVFPDMHDAIEDLNEEALVDAIENAVPQYKMLLQIAAMTQSFTEDVKAKSVEKKPSVDEILENFLKVNFLS
jgi:multidrug efflux pump subunit AcrA (membrane-fusion protein)